MLKKLPLIGVLEDHLFLTIRFTNSGKVLYTQVNMQSLFERHGPTTLKEG
jgi:hypothetical protein